MSPSSAPRPLETSLSGKPGDESAALAEILREIPPGIAQGMQKFNDDLEELLQEHRGEWVAYGAQGRIALGQSKRAIYQHCLDLGLNERDFIVQKVLPKDDDAIEVLYYS
jgi:hypothetical protein